MVGTDESDYSAGSASELVADLVRHLVSRCVPGVEHREQRRLLEIQEAPADVLVGDVALAAGPLLHELGGPPFASFGISTIAVPGPDLPPFGLGLPPADGGCRRRRNRLLTRITDGMITRPLADAIIGVRGQHGLPPRHDISLASPGPSQLFLQPSTPASDYPRTDLPASPALRRTTAAARRSDLAATRLVA